ncbi:MAG: long-chain fatty acid--CoA ligase [Acidobacteriaceae bacterium]|nr:long-chain fatty acid--CoA ligase [Acidobacteriaceae bacterium]
MNALASPIASIRDALISAGCLRCRVLCGATSSVAIKTLLHGSSLGCNHAGELSGRSILLTTNDQLAAALALIELDGIASRIVICPPETTPEHFPSLIGKGSIDTVVSDYELPKYYSLTGLSQVRCGSTIRPVDDVHIDRRPTEWVLLSSGTTGAPKMIVHNLTSLVAPIKLATSPGEKLVWGTFYDIRRYGGLQVFLRAALGGGSLVLSGDTETTGEHLIRLSKQGVTHLSGTPSQWRRALMSPEAHRIDPSYIRLSGEIVDQAILNALRSFYPKAAVGHAFASTEAGVGFEVNDGLAGFPAAILNHDTSVEIKVCNDSLRIRSNRTASHYLDGRNGALVNGDGFVDTGDIVELRGDRYYFLGRRNGVINVGGLKVYPEEVEAVINRHPAVRMSVVRPRRNPITGSLVSADIMLKDASLAEQQSQVIKSEILEICQQSLAHHKIPVIIRYVNSVGVAATGKLSRHDA